MFGLTFLNLPKNGINIQASCDAKCCFTFLGIGGPGTRQDCNGIKDSAWYDFVDMSALVSALTSLPNSFW